MLVKETRIEQRKQRKESYPYAGMIRIRFKGFFSGCLQPPLRNG